MPWNPPDTKNIQNGINLPLNKYTICTPAQRDAFITMVQPLFSVVLTWGEEQAPAPDDYNYTIDPTDTRRKFGFTSRDDKSVQFQLIAPYLQMMFANGAVPGAWEWQKVVEVGGKTPGKVFPSKLVWKPLSTSQMPAKNAPVNVQTVDVNQTLAQLILNE